MISLGGVKPAVSGLISQGKEGEKGLVPHSGCTLTASGSASSANPSIDQHLDPHRGHEHCPYNSSIKWADSMIGAGWLHHATWK